MTAPLLIEDPTDTSLAIARAFLCALEGVPKSQVNAAYIHIQDAMARRGTYMPLCAQYFDFKGVAPEASSTYVFLVDGDRPIDLQGREGWDDIAWALAERAGIEADHYAFGKRYIITPIADESENEEFSKRFTHTLSAIDQAFMLALQTPLANNEEARRL